MKSRRSVRCQVPWANSAKLSVLMWPLPTLVTLASDLPEDVDLLLLDGAKTLYGDVLNLVEKHLRRGALVVADNTDYCPQYLVYVRAPENGYLSVPFADDIELSIRL